MWFRNKLFRLYRVKDAGVVAFRCHYRRTHAHTPVKKDYTTPQHTVYGIYLHTYVYVGTPVYAITNENWQTFSASLQTRLSRLFFFFAFLPSTFRFYYFFSYRTALNVSITKWIEFITFLNFLVYRCQSLSCWASWGLYICMFTTLTGVYMEWREKLMFYQSVYVHVMSTYLSVCNV